ncbi:hypothetical protein MB901379_00999 [Mycobacterium basiliense]|uniref:Anti-sigma-D factor RsdA sigma factor binding region domain-containing protein n=1 Tax=Mycobacterium basiliense TaxID=2094119 RepID=A0A3S4FNZ7_9MYCO|nr:anti-sigma-D factor RsdA [Mycobacterium basiliense]VDM87457.1 hypothetical protein MB901379_00999 [Mycobacterium basiliense]
MPNSGFALGDQPSLGPRLDEVARTDLLLDALAGREEVNLEDPDDDALAALLGEWRDDLRWPPASALVSQDEAVEALIVGMVERRRSRRSLAAIGSVAATLLLLSGFGAVVAEARPGDLLYGLHAMIFNEPRISDDQIMLSAKADLAKAEQLIALGEWDQAQTQLAEVSSTLQAVNDGSRRQNLMNELNQLNTKVEKRDPNATLSPSSPPQSELVGPGDSPRHAKTPLAPETAAPTPPSAPVSAPPAASGVPESTPPNSPVVSASSAPSSSPLAAGSDASAPSPSNASTTMPTAVPSPSSLAPGEAPTTGSSTPGAGATAPGPPPTEEPADASTG